VAKFQVYRCVRTDLGGAYMLVEWLSMNTIIAAPDSVIALAKASVKFPKKRGMLAVQPIVEK
jgi:hypothetical protein